VVEFVALAWRREASVSRQVIVDTPSEFDREMEA